LWQTALRSGYVFSRANAVRHRNNSLPAATTPGPSTACCSGRLLRARGLQQERAAPFPRRAHAQVAADCDSEILKIAETATEQATAGNIRDRAGYSGSSSQIGIQCLS